MRAALKIHRFPGILNNAKDREVENLTTKNLKPTAGNRDLKTKIEKAERYTNARGWKDTIHGINTPEMEAEVQGLPLTTMESLIVPMVEDGTITMYSLWNQLSAAQEQALLKTLYLPLPSLLEANILRLVGQDNSRA